MNEEVKNGKSSKEATTYLHILGVGFFLMALGWAGWATYYLVIENGNELSLGVYATSIGLMAFSILFLVGGEAYRPSSWGTLLAGSQAVILLIPVIQFSMTMLRVGGDLTRLTQGLAGF